MTSLKTLQMVLSCDSKVEAHFPLGKKEDRFHGQRRSCFVATNPGPEQISNHVGVTKGESYKYLNIQLKVRFFKRIA